MDVVFDDAASLLEEERLDLELLVFYDPVTETLHAVGYDGAPARYFRVLEDLPTTEEATPTVRSTSSTEIEIEEPPIAPPPAVPSSEEEPPLPLPLTALAGSSAPARAPHIPQDEEDRGSSNGPLG